MEAVVLERAVPGAEASSAAAGILSPCIESVHGGSAEGLALGVRSRELHATLAARLLDEHAIDVGFRRTGVMRVAKDTHEVAELDAHERALSGQSYERMGADEARKREPSLHPEVLSAIDLQDDAQLEPRVFLRALALAAERAGAEFRTGVPVQRVEPGQVPAVVVGGERLEADHVIVAAGSWTSMLPGVRLAADAIVPVRGQMLATHTRPPVFRRVMFGAGGYVLTRPDGRVLIGSTEEKVGFVRGVTIGGIRSITDVALGLAPSLKSARMLDSWSSFRPGTADALPLVGPAGPDGVWLASGHFRNGILLAPVTAEVIAAGLLGESDPHAALLDPRRATAGVTVH